MRRIPIPCAQRRHTVKFAHFGDSMSVRLAGEFVGGTCWYPSFSFGVGGSTSGDMHDSALSQIYVSDYIAIIWTGHNDYGYQDYGSRVIDNIALTIAALNPYDYVVVSVMTAAGARAPYVEDTNGINANLAAIHGNRFVALLPYILSRYNESIPQDVTDYNAGIVPSSLRVDDVHLTTYAYQISMRYIMSHMDGASII